MFRIAEYLVQAQAALAPQPVLRLLETRGGGSPLFSIYHLLRAVLLVAHGRVTGRLAGVHVNGAERLSLVRKGVLMAACKALGVRTILHLHAAELPSTYASLSRPARALVRWIFGLPDCCIVLGRTAADFLQHTLLVRPDKVHIVLNGVPEPMARSQGRTAGRPLRILFVGNLSERKGVSDLLHALREPALRDVQLELVLAGGGDVHGYRALACKLALQDRVTFLGWAEKALVDRYLAEADVFVLPSRHEGLPLAILEALALRVPVVCTPVGEIPHVLKHRQHALLVEPGDRPAIAAALAELGRSESLRAGLASSGRHLYERHFSMRQFARRVARIHQEQFGLSAPSGH